MSLVTLNDVVTIALARLQEYNLPAPPVRSLLYRRIGIRQQELAIVASRANRDYYGVAGLATVVAGAIDINDIAPPVPWPEFIHKVQVGAIAGGATVAVGDEVSIVRLGDESAEEAPRVTMRSGVMRQVGTDLNGVTTLKVYYSKIPELYAVAEDGSSQTVIPSPFDQLLVLDLVALMLKRALRGDASDLQTTTALTALAEESSAWEAKWVAHVSAYGTPRTRFDR